MWLQAFLRFQPFQRWKITLDFSFHVNRLGWKYTSEHQWASVMPLFFVKRKGGGKKNIQNNLFDAHPHTHVAECRNTVIQRPSNPSLHVPVQWFPPPPYPPPPTVTISGMALRSFWKHLHGKAISCSSEIKELILFIAGWISWIKQREKHPRAISVRYAAAVTSSSS